MYPPPFRDRHGVRFFLLAFVCLFWIGTTLPAFAQGPLVSGTLPNRTVLSGTGEQLNLNTVFTAQDAPGTVVQLTVAMTGTSLVSATSTINLALTDTATPVTVANFLNYLRAGAYNNSFIHRAIPGFVIQGGGFALSGTADVPSDFSAGITVIPTALPIASEVASSLPNTLGTVAMALSGGTNNTATNEWFINLADNSGNLDYQNGGFTVFGTVMGNGMAVANAVAGLNTFAFSSPFDELPLGWNRFQGDVTSPVPQSQFALIESVAVVPTLTYSATSSNPAVAAVTSAPANNLLSLAYGTSGTAVVTVTATDLDGNATPASFNVVVEPPTTGLVAFASGSTTVSGTYGTAVLQVVRTGVTSGSFTVQYSTGDGTAIGGSDYTETSGTLTFGDGVINQTIGIPITGGTVPSPGKTFNVRLFGPINNVILGTGSAATVTICDAGALQLSSTNYSAGEGTGTMQVQVIRTGGSAGPVSAVIGTQDGTAKTGSDYTGMTRLVTFADGDTTPKSISIPLGAASGSGQTKQFTISLQPVGGVAVGAVSAAVASINDFAEVGIPSANYRVSGSSAMALITVQRTGTAVGASVPFTTADGSAKAGVDYTGTSGIVSFPAGATTQTIQVPIWSGTTASERSFAVNLTGTATNLVIDPNHQSATVVIAPFATATNGVFTVDSLVYRFDTSSSAFYPVTIDRSVATGTASAFVELIDGSAVFGQNYSVYSSTTGAALPSRLVEVDFAAGVRSQSFYLTGSGSGMETLTAQIVNTSEGSVPGVLNTAQITFSGTQTAGGLIEFSQPSNTVNTSNGKAIVTVTRGPLTAGTATVSYTTGTGTAKAGRDYVSTSGTLTFQPGVAFQDIEVPLKASGASGVYFKVALANATGGAVMGAQNVTTITVVRGKPTDSVAFQSSSYLFDANASSIDFNNLHKVVIVGKSTQVSGTVYVELIDESALLGQDYFAFYATENDPVTRVVPVTLNSGSANLYLLGPVNSSKQFKLRLVGVSGTQDVIGTPNTAVVNFLGAPNGLVEFNQSAYIVDESAGYVSLGVHRTGTSGSVSFQCSPVNGTARNKVDYSFAPGTSFSFPAGVNSINVPVKLLANTAPNPSARSFTIKLSGIASSSGALLGAINQSATVTIIAQNDPRGIFEFESAAYPVSEDSGWANLVVLRGGGSKGAADVFVTTSDIWSDGLRNLIYSWPGPQNATKQHPLQVHFEPGQTRQELLIPLADGAVSRVIENPQITSPLQFTATLVNPSGGRVGAAASAVVSDYASENLATPSIAFDSTQYRVNDNGAGSIALHAKLYYSSGSIWTAVSVPFEIRSNSAQLTAALGTDFLPVGGSNVVLSATTPEMDGTATVAMTVSGTLTFPPGIIEADLPFTIVSGSAFTPEKRFSVQLQSPVSSGTLLAQTAATVTIVSHNASAGVFQVQQPAYSADEDCGALSFNIVRSGSTASAASIIVTTNDGSASGDQYDTNGNLTGFLDYGSFTETLNFAKGETQKSIALPVRDHMLASGSGTFLVRIESADGGAQIGATNSAVVTLFSPYHATSTAMDFDRPSYGINSSTGGFTATVRRIDHTGASGILTAYYAVNSSIGTQISGTVTLPAGQITAQISGTLTGLPPGPLTIQLKNLQDISNPSDTVVSLGNNPATLVSGSANPYGVFEFDAPSYSIDRYTSGAYYDTVPIRVIRSGPTTSAASVRVVTGSGNGGIGVAGVDYTPVNAVVNFPVGQAEEQVDVPLVGKNAPRSFTVDLIPIGKGSVGPRGSAFVNLEPMPPPTWLAVGFLYSSYGVDVTDTNADAVVRLLASGTNPVKIPWSTVATAMSGTGFSPTSGTLILAGTTSGESAVTGTISIPMTNGTNVTGPNQAFLWRLDNWASTGTSSVPLTGNRLVPEIIQCFNDPHGVLEFGASSYSAPKAGTAKVTIVREGGTSGAATVAVLLSSGPTADVSVPLSGFSYGGMPYWLVTFAPGSAGPRTIPFNITGKATAGDVINLILYSTTSSGGTILGAHTTATITVE